MTCTILLFKKIKTKVILHSRLKETLDGERSNRIRSATVTTCIKNLFGDIKILRHWFPNKENMKILKKKMSFIASW